MAKAKSVNDIKSQANRLISSFSNEMDNAYLNGDTQKAERLNDRFHRILSAEGKYLRNIYSISSVQKLIQRSDNRKQAHFNNGKPMYSSKTIQKYEDKINNTKVPRDVYMNGVERSLSVS